MRFLKSIAAALMLLVGTASAQYIPADYILDGPGTGLDADTLDGVDSTGFSPNFTVTLPLSKSSNVVSIPEADNATDGYMSKEDRALFAGSAAANSTDVTLDDDATNDLMSLSGQALRFDTIAPHKIPMGPATGLTAAQPVARLLVVEDLPSAVVLEGEGDSVINGSAPITVSGGTVSIPEANGSTDGYMSGTIWMLLDTTAANNSTDVTLTGTGATDTFELTSQALGLKDQLVNTFLGTALGSGGQPIWRVLDDTDIPSGITRDDEVLPIVDANITGTYPLYYEPSTHAMSWTGSTDDVPQGSTNMYYADSLARAALYADAPLYYDNADGHFYMTQADSSTYGYISNTNYNNWIANDSANSTDVTLSGTPANALLGLSGQAITLDNQLANVFLRGPNSGGSGPVSFGGIVDADIPAAIARDSEITSALSAYPTLASILVASPKSVYVSFGGNDSTGTGSSALPFLTLDRAAQYVNATSSGGAFVVFLDFGTYTLSSTSTNQFPSSSKSTYIVGKGIDRSQISIATSGNYTSGANTFARFYLAGGAGFNLYSDVISGYSTDGGTLIPVAGQRWESVKFTGPTNYTVGCKLTLGTSSDYAELYNCDGYSTGELPLSQVNVYNGTWFGVIFQNSGTVDNATISGAQYLRADRITDCTISSTNNVQIGFASAPRSTLISGNTISNSGTSGIQLNVDASTGQITNNTISCPLGTGISVYYASVFSSNTVTAISLSAIATNSFTKNRCVLTGKLSTNSPINVSDNYLEYVGSARSPFVYDAMTAPRVNFTNNYIRNTGTFSEAPPAGTGDVSIIQIFGGLTDYNISYNTFVSPTNAIMLGHTNTGLDTTVLSQTRSATISNNRFYQIFAAETGPDDPHSSIIVRSAGTFNILYNDFTIDASAALNTTMNENAVDVWTPSSGATRVVNIVGGTVTFTGKSTSLSGGAKRSIFRLDQNGSATASMRVSGVTILKQTNIDNTFAGAVAPEITNLAAALSAGNITYQTTPSVMTGSDLKAGNFTAVDVNTGTLTTTGFNALGSTTVPANQLYLSDINGQSIFTSSGAASDTDLTASIGDVGVLGNGTKITIDDGSGLIDIAGNVNATGSLNGSSVGASTGTITTLGATTGNISALNVTGNLTTLSLSSNSHELRPFYNLGLFLNGGANASSGLGILSLANYNANATSAAISGNGILTRLFTKGKPTAAGAVPTNYEATEIHADPTINSGGLTIRSVAGGTGTVRPIYLDSTAGVNIASTLTTLSTTTASHEVRPTANLALFLNGGNNNTGELGVLSIANYNANATSAAISGNGALFRIFTKGKPDAAGNFPTNYELTEFQANPSLNSGGMTIKSRAGGTGTVRPIYLESTAGVNTTGNHIVSGNLTLSTAGSGLLIKTGSNATAGTTSAMVAGTTTVSTTKITASSIVMLTAQNTITLANEGDLSVDTRVAATSFVIKSSNVLDTRTVGWVIIEPAP